jgi:hypothetical protein
MRWEPIQLLKGKWFLSTPAMVAGGLYATVTVGLDRLWGLPRASLLGDTSVLLASGSVIVGAFLVGVGASLARERSLSVLPAILALIAGGILRIVLLRLG